MPDSRTPGTAWRGFAVLIVVFLAGALAGGVGGRMALRHEFEGRASTSANERRRGAPAVDIDQIPTPLLQLSLTQEQEARLHDIARRWRPRAGNELTAMRQRVGELENGMFADMLCVITPAQRDRYLSMLRDSHMPQEVIDKRFAVVRGNGCPAL